MSKNFSETIPKWIVITFLIVSFFGFADAAYLTVEHYLGGVPNCGPLEGCDVVATSSYAVIAEIPVALLGTVYYLGIFLATMMFLDVRDSRILVWTARATTIGFLASIVFSYIQFVVLGAVCVYCIGSAITSTLLFIVGMVFLSQRKKRSATSV